MGRACVEGAADLLLRAHAHPLARLEAELLAVDAAVAGDLDRKVRAQAGLPRHLERDGAGGNAHELRHADVPDANLPDVLADRLLRQRCRGSRRLRGLAAEHLPELRIRAVRADHQERQEPAGDDGSRVISVRVGSYRVLKPGLLPEDPALRLAAPVSGAVTARLAEEDSVGHPSAPGLAAHVVADLLEPSVDRHRATCVRHHLGHERNALERARLVERRENVGQGAEPDLVACAQRPRPDRATCRRQCSCHARSLRSFHSTGPTGVAMCQILGMSTPTPSAILPGMDWRRLGASIRR